MAISLQPALPLLKVVFDDELGELFASLSKPEKFKWERDVAAQRDGRGIIAEQPYQQQGDADQAFGHDQPGHMSLDQNDLPMDLDV